MQPFLGLFFFSMLLTTGCRVCHLQGRFLDAKNTQEEAAWRPCAFCSRICKSGLCGCCDPTCVQKRADNTCSFLRKPGASLECETCLGVGRHCTGPHLPCDAGKDTCVVALSKSSVGVAVESIVKGCGSSSECGSEPFSMTMGEGKTSRTKTVCCTGDACKSVTPELPPVNTNSNGMQCPACYSLIGSCPAEVAYCTGSEDHCFVMVSRVTTGGIKVDTTMKGCATAKVCTDLKRGNAEVGGVGVTIAEAKCWLASQAPPSTGFSLLALSGLLVMKMLF